PAPVAAPQPEASAPVAAPQAEAPAPQFEAPVYVEPTTVVAEDVTPIAATPVNPVSSAPVVTTGEVPTTDVEGTPWDERIHTSTKKMTQKGVWKRRKGVDPEEFERIKAEIRGETAEHEPPQVVVPTVAPQPEAPAPVAAPQPEASAPRVGYDQNGEAIPPAYITGEPVGTFDDVMALATHHATNPQFQEWFSQWIEANGFEAGAGVMAIKDRPDLCQVIVPSIKEHFGDCK
ncbi:MAG: hypothetical protein MI756_01135, partial [Chromatiales bacterium]|nr:hypothetical protein [Chromatiales bacterium]